MVAVRISLALTTSVMKKSLSTWMKPLIYYNYLLERRTILLFNHKYFWNGTFIVVNQTFGDLYWACIVCFTLITVYFYDYSGEKKVMNFFQQMYHAYHRFTYDIQLVEFSSAWLMVQILIMVWFLHLATCNYDTHINYSADKLSSYSAWSQIASYWIQNGC